MNDTVAGLRETFASASQKLAAAGAKDEMLAELTTRRLLLGLVRQPVLKLVTRVWRLGVLLLARDGTVYATVTSLGPPRQPVPRTNQTRQRNGVDTAR